MITDLSAAARRCLPLLAFLNAVASAHNCLSLSTAAAVPPGGTALLELSLDPETPGPASLQWSFRASGIANLDVATGPAAAAADKTVLCRGDASVYTCLLAGANANAIAGGVVARVRATLAPGVATARISITDAAAASPDGFFTIIYADGGIVTSGRVSSDRRLRPPLRRVAGGGCRAARP